MNLYKSIKTILYYCLIFSIGYLLYYIKNNTEFFLYIKNGKTLDAFMEVFNLLLKYLLIIIIVLFCYLSFTKELNSFFHKIFEIFSKILPALYILFGIYLLYFIFICGLLAYNNYNNMYNFLKLNIQNFIPVFQYYCPFSNLPHIDEHFTQKNNYNSDLIENFENSEKLKYINDICPPIKIFNDNINDYQDLLLSDFHFIGAYNSLVYGFGKNSFLNLNNLIQLLLPANNPVNGFGMRILHFKIEFDENNVPLITNEYIDKSNRIDLYTCMQKINNLAWKQPVSTKCILPLFLYFEFLESNLTGFEYVNNIINEVFNNKLINKKYGYSGRNNKFSVSHASLEESFGKVIIISNIYPTLSIFDEIINISTNDDSQCLVLKYTKEFHNFNTGVSTNHSKIDLKNRSKNSFIMVIPNFIQKNNIELINPDIEDSYKHGVQFVLTNPFLNYGNTNYSNKQNMDILKDFSLKYNSILLKDNDFRYLKKKTPDIKKIYSIYKPNNVKTLEIIPGFANKTTKGGFQ